MTTKSILRLVRLAVALAGFCFATSTAAASSKSWNASEEDVKSLIVMIEVTLKGEARAGSGIICGTKDDSLYIVTANHVVREGEDEATEIRLNFKWLPGKPIKAT